jgi:hypothetical protein
MNQNPLKITLSGKVLVLRNPFPIHFILKLANKIFGKVLVFGNNFPT